MKPIHRLHSCLACYTLCYFTFIRSPPSQNVPFWILKWKLQQKLGKTLKLGKTYVITIWKCFIWGLASTFRFNLLLLLDLTEQVVYFLCNNLPNVTISMWDMNQILAKHKPLWGISKLVKLPVTRKTRNINTKQQRLFSQT